MTLFRSTCLVWSLSLSFAAFTACSDDDGGGGSIALANLGDAVGSAYCAKAFECCTAAEIMVRFQGTQVTDEASCRMFYAAVFTAFAGNYQASVDAGKLVYDGAAASQCVSALRAMACTDFARDDDPLSSQCPNPFQGQVANGMQCAFDEECQSGYCEGDALLPEPGTPGTCKAPPTAGQACPDFTCADGLQCQAGTCMALKPDGASCYDGEECASAGCNGASNGSPGTCGVPMTCNGQ